jgi:hypothetical protein
MIVAKIVQWLSTGTGRIVSALMLFGAVWLLENSPIVKDWLDGKPAAKRASAIALAILPAAAAGLWAGVPLDDVWQTAVTAFLAATGLNQLTHKMKAADK